MPAYLIAEIAVTDAEAYKAYTSRVPDLIAKAGGRYLVRGGKTAAVEGGPVAGRIVVLEFQNFAAAEAFYHSQDYQAILAFRTNASTGRVYLVDGMA